MCLVFSVGYVKCIKGNMSRQASGVSNGILFWWRGVCKNAGVGVCKGMDSKEGVLCCTLLRCFVLGLPKLRKRLSCVRVCVCCGGGVGG